MILLVLIASVLIAGVTIYQYREQSKDYHKVRLERKEGQIKQSIAYTLQETTYPVTTENLALIFKDEIYRIADVQNVNFNIYDLKGNLIKSSKPRFRNDSISLHLDSKIIEMLSNAVNKRYILEDTAAGDKYHASFTYINDDKFKPIGILNLPYYEDNTLNDMELREFLMRLSVVYLFMLLIAVVLAYFISKYITRSLQTISDKITQTDLTKRNEKILIENPGHEIGKLIDSYNEMID